MRVRAALVLVLATYLVLGCGARSPQPAIENHASTPSAESTSDGHADASGDAVARAAADAEARRAETERQMLEIVDRRIAEAVNELSAATSESARDVANAKLEFLRGERARILEDRARRTSVP